MYLVGDEAKLPEGVIQPDVFAKDILGFEEIQDEEDGDTQPQLVYADQEGSFPPGMPEDNEEGGMPDSELKEAPSQVHDPSGP